MTRTAVIDEIDKRLEALPRYLQERVLGFAAGLAATFPKGMSAQEALQIAGTISSEEAARMMAVIEEEFEKVDGA